MNYNKNTHQSVFAFSNQLGYRNYEVTNHLGNVQAVVRDQRLAKATVADSDLIYRPVLQAVYDYYPFGMLMPGRYIEDTTSNNCVTVTQRIDRFIARPPSGLMPPGSGGPGTGGFRIAGDEQNTDPVGSATLSTDATETGYALSIDGTADGIGSSSFLTIDETDVDHELQLTVDGLSGGTFSAEIIEQDDTGAWRQLASVGIVSTGIYNMPFHPIGSVLKLNVTNTNTGGGGGSKHIHIPPPGDVTLDRYITTSYTTCNAPRDGYRFGFNGKEKDNEIAGIGNFQDYGFREYDTRIARFNSMDPIAKQYPMLTPYQFASNNPISGIDLDGKEYLGSNESRVEFKYGQLRLKVENFHIINRNAVYRADQDHRNWKAEQIGVDRSIANISIMAPEPPTPKGDDISDMLKPAERYQSRFASNKYDQRPGISGPVGTGARAANMTVVLDAIKTGLETYVQWAGKDDAEKIEAHRTVANKVGADMTRALDKGIIPPKYQNREDIVNIMNVVLQGENNTNDPEIYKIGKQVYDMNNPKKEEYVPSGLDNFPGRTVPIQQPAGN